MNTTTDAKPVGLLINRNFGLLFIGQTISALGDTIFDFTTLIWVAVILAKGQPWAPLAVSGIVVAESLPRLVIRPVSGVFVDRWNRRRTMLIADAARAIIVVITLFATGLFPLPFIDTGALPLTVRLGALYLAILALNSYAQFFNPSRLAIISEIVTDDLRPHASGLEQSVGNLVRLIGPPLSAPLLFTLGVQWALSIDAISFGLSFLFILAIHPPSDLVRSQSITPPVKFMQEFREGWSYVMTRGFFRTMIAS